jgi:invasion protein IalB
MNALGYFGSANLLTLAFALGTSLAIAQEAQPVPKTTAPTAGPAATPRAAAAGAPGTVEAGQSRGSAWVKVCNENEQDGNTQLCLVKYEGVNPTTGMVQVTAAVRAAEGEDKKILLVGVTTAYTLVIPVGVQIKIDDGQPISLKYITCLSPTCNAQTELTKEIFDKMRKGKQMVVAVMSMQQKTMGFQISLAGFANAYDGPPVDNAKYEEAQRRMEEARQIVRANRVAEQKKVQGTEQLQGGATPQAGAQVPAQPPATTSVQKKTPAIPAP